MRVLHHLPLSPASRALRLALAEKGLEFALAAEPVWERRPEFLARNPAGDVPMLADGRAGDVCGTWAIVEYLEEAYPDPPLWPRGPRARAECRRIAGWFAVKFAAEVSGPLVHEIAAKPRFRLGQPDSRALRAAHDRMAEHLAYVGALFADRRWLGGDTLSHADLAAAAQISVADYLGGVRWPGDGPARDWYARMKSRPSFRPLLADREPGIAPPPHYADLDF